MTGERWRLILRRAPTPGMIELAHGIGLETGRLPWCEPQGTDTIYTTLFP
jgi:hypothetical protein